MLQSGPVLNGEVKFPQPLELPGSLSFWISKAEQPLESSMVSSDLEWAAIQIDIEVVYSLDHS